jgi:hypothetical protein
LTNRRSRLLADTVVLNRDVECATQLSSRDVDLLCGLFVALAQQDKATVGSTNAFVAFI